LLKKRTILENKNIHTQLLSWIQKPTIFLRTFHLENALEIDACFAKYPEKLMFESKLIDTSFL